MIGIIHPLRVRRVLSGQTQWDLALATGLPQCVISLIETGKLKDIPEGKKIKIAQALNSSVLEIFPAMEET
ncbi:MAG: helix-turn-helix transcriptional regulator [Pseudomonadota bacterium]